MKRTRYLILFSFMCFIALIYLKKDLNLEQYVTIFNNVSIKPILKDAIISTLPNVSLTNQTNIADLVNQYPILLIRDYLVNKNFEKLNSTLEEYQSAFEKNPSAEGNLFEIYFNAFYYKDNNFEPILNEWVSKYPKQYQPYLARASYYYSRAWEARGGKLASETSKEQFKGMQAFFDKVNTDVKQVLTIRPNHFVPYYFLINIQKAIGDKSTLKPLLDLALKNCPTSFQLRYTYLLAISPRWRGSFEQMMNFAEESQKFLFRNPKIALLKGYVYHDASELEFHSKNYSTALGLVEKAMNFGESARFYELRAKINKKLEKFDDALKDIDSALALSPQDADLYHNKASVLGSKKLLNESFEAIEIAALLNPNDQNIAEFKEWLAYQLYSKARELIDTKDYDSAKAELDKAININPVNIDFYKNMDWLLANKSNWDEIIHYWNRYLSHKPDDDMAYMERGGAYFHKGDLASAVADAKKAADMGNEEGKKVYERYKGSVKN